MRRKGDNPGVLLSTEDAAYCAAAWASGETQKSLAKIFGYKGTSTICFAIGDFLDRFSGTTVRYYSHSNHCHAPAILTSDQRKQLVPEALKRFIEFRSSKMDALETK